MKNDPVLLKKIGKNKLYIHSSHKLPSYLQQFPFYDRALPRICKELKNIDKKLEVIDVGANVGDTVSLILEQVKGDFLCIEGDKKYLPLLRKNIFLLEGSNIEIESNYCAESSLDDFSIDNRNGTAKLVLNETKNKNIINNFKSLDKIVKDHPNFKNANILKIDTDGYEINVLKSGKKYISNAKPIIFLEFTPSAYEDFKQSYEDLIKTLIDYGYSKALFYDNFGVPIQIDDLENDQNIKELISRIDNKNVYYYDVLVLNKENQDKYIDLFSYELIKHIQESNSAYKKTLNKLNQQKLISQSNCSKLETKTLELNNANEKVINLSDALNRMQNTKLWQLAEKIRRLTKILLPKNSLQRASLKKMNRLLLHVFQYLPMLFKVRVKNFIKCLHTNTNRQSKKIVYIGHSYHDKTQSTSFLINYLKEHFEVTVILDETWQGKAPPNLDFIDDSYLGVVFFQMIYPIEIINKIKNKNLIFCPMYDGSGALPNGYWLQYKNIKFINFSRTLHKKLIGLGLNSLCIQYFPKQKEFVPGDKKKIFFWQRVTNININTIEKLFIKNEYNFQLHLHKAIDPEHEFVQPNKEQEKKFSITYSDWFKNKDGLLNLIKKTSIYVAPREYEGIGLSFLEAMSMGKAVVAVDNPTMNEYIEHNKTGYLFNLNNVKELNLDNFESVQKNCYSFMKNGYKKWEVRKFKIISFIKK